MKKQNKQTKLANSLCIISGITGAMLLLLRELITQSKMISDEVSLLLPAILILNSIAILLLNYLKTGSALSFTANTSNQTMLSSVKRFSNQSIWQDSEKKETCGITLREQDKHKLLHELETKLLQKLSGSLQETITPEHTNNAQRRKHMQQLRQQFQQVSNRLINEIESLGRKANLNLVIGVLTTITAVVMLSAIVMKSSHQLTNAELVTYYIPRITLSVFIELFSFFFLRLYKASLNEIKYFQNELTTVELKFIAAEKAMMSNNDDVTALVINELVSTERNFKLAPGESTVELEKQKNEQRNNQTQLETIVSLLKTKI